MRCAPPAIYAPASSLRTLFTKLSTKAALARLNN